MTCIHGRKVNEIYEYNLLHYILNPPKRDKILIINYSPITHGYMNTRMGRKKFKKSRILFYCVCSSKVVTERLIQQPNPK